jgi:hypothetical protein
VRLIEFVSLRGGQLQAGSSITGDVVAFSGGGNGFRVTVSDSDRDR